MSEKEIAIQTSGLSRWFPVENGKFYAVKDVSIEISKGTLNIIKGRSGSGKTTLLNMLSTLDEPSEGKITFLGNDLSTMPVSGKETLRRKDMGFVFQSIALIPVMSAYENVDFALRLADYKEDHHHRIREVMERVGLLKRMDHMTGQLSGGEQQRVAIARAVAHHPAVLFADEPTGALDTASGLAVMGLFRELVEKEGTTIIMTTHDPNLMELGDKVFEIQDGQIL
ncbi:MAG: ABC transporter ATP-binding protein [Agathobacter sp.]|nr:ABC transporter ATP-binding protein [Agathobacter sp.]